MTGTNLNAQAHPVSNTATRLGGTALNRQSLTIANPDNNSNTFYIGQAGVTIASGFPLPPGAFLALDLTSGTDVYIIANSAGENCRILEVG